MEQKQKQKRHCKYKVRSHISTNRQGTPFSRKDFFLSSKAELIKDPATINQLIDQVYQFSRMYWKSVSQQNLPVTIKYPEMVAEIFPYFSQNKLTDLGKENLCFL